MLPYITASRELHPTLKTHLIGNSITPLSLFGKSFFGLAFWTASVYNLGSQTKETQKKLGKDTEEYEKIFKRV